MKFKLLLVCVVYVLSPESSDSDDENSDDDFLYAKPDVGRRKKQTMDMQIVNQRQMPANERLQRYPQKWRKKVCVMTTVSLCLMPVYVIASFFNQQFLNQTQQMQTLEEKIQNLQRAVDFSHQESRDKTEEAQWWKKKYEGIEKMMLTFDSNQKKMQHWRRFAKNMQHQCFNETKKIQHLKSAIETDLKICHVEAQSCKEKLAENEASMQNCKGNEKLTLMCVDPDKTALVIWKPPLKTEKSNETLGREDHYYRLLEKAKKHAAMHVVKVATNFGILLGVPTFLIAAAFIIIDIIDSMV